MRRLSVRPVHTSSMVAAVAVALCLALLLPTRAVAEAPPEAAAAAPGVALAGAAAAAAPRSYNPAAGVLTNNPLGSPQRRRAINAHLLRLISSVPGGEKIRIASWNLRSRAFVEALVRAHRRGVSVRFVVARGNARPSHPNPGVNQLQNALTGSGNESRPAADRSRLRRCTSACRGPRGIAHTKFFLFSRVGGGTRDVVVNGSANATDVAAHSQWNDVYTTKNRRGIYDVFARVHAQMMRDKNVAKPYVSTRHGGITTYFNPYHGAGDPWLRRLNATSCRGATNGTGTNGRTKIRIAMTSWHGARGLRLAGRLKQMHNRGCDVRIIYAVTGGKLRKVLQRGGRGPVPMRQVAKANDQGVYVRYLHMKVMTISGVHAGRRDARVTYNGSENWSPAALPSDEAGMRIYSGRVLASYNRWIERLFRNPPYSSRVSGRVAARAANGDDTLDVSELPPALVERYARERGIDPYALMEVD